MWVASLKNEELKKIKKQLEEDEKIQHVAFQWGVSEGEYDALITRIIEEIGVSEVLLKLQKNIRELLNYTGAESESETMKYETYSERERAKQEPAPYQYDEISHTLQEQILYVVEDISSLPSVLNIYCRKRGMPSEINQAGLAKSTFRSDMEKNNLKATFDIIEIAFHLAEKQGVSHDKLKAKTDELNNYFQKASFGYQLIENQIVRIDDKKATHHRNNDSKKTSETVKDFYNAGFWHLQRGDYDAAIESFTESLKQQPDYVYALLNRSSAWAKKGEYDKAIADCNEIIRLKPDFSSAWSYRGAAWYNKGEYDKAIEDLSRALFLEPNDVNAWKVRGDAFLEKGEYDKSIADYKEARRLSPADEEIIQKQTIAMASKRSLEENTDINKKRKRIVKTTVKKIKTHDFDHELESTLTDLNLLIDNSPTSRVAPAFGFADDGLLHINLPPDLQDAPSGDEVFEELKAAKNDLKQALDRSNAHSSLLEAVKQYDQVFSDKQLSISFLYVRGIRLENAVDAIRQDIASGDLPPFSIDIERNINSVLKLHGTYISLQEEGKTLVEASSAYRQSPQQAERVEIEVKNINFSIAGDNILFGEDVKQYVPIVIRDIGKGPYPERSNQVAAIVLVSLVSDLINATLLGSVPGTSAVTIGIEATNAIWFFISNAIPLLKIIAASVASDASWLASISDLVDRFKNLQNTRD